MLVLCFFHRNVCRGGLQSEQQTAGSFAVPGDGVDNPGGRLTLHMYR